MPFGIAILAGFCPDIYQYMIQFHLLPIHVSFQLAGFMTLLQG